ncbi:MAG: TIGR02300 family protein [Bartonella sp.]|uniref:TIGR02300 family protein n=1 Tax=Bartonella apis TaxID=1686310 RepID=UPI00242C5407|nr:TIGR02300 family protein [Bartonella apis]MCT6870768.1 TIGR02300 family protein [Bartonella sp.]
MAKPELGTKRIDPETGKKFYDLNRDPIVSPYTGLSYPRSYFEASAEAKGEDDEDTETEELDTALEKPEFISLEDADDEAKGDDDIPDMGDDDVDLGDDDDDAFLPDDEDDEDDDVSGIITGGNKVHKDDDI